jgi:hypothetical protein
VVLAFGCGLVGGMGRRKLEMLKCAGVSPKEDEGRVMLIATRQETVDMFYHGYDNYIKIAFPEDEVGLAPWPAHGDTPRCGV